MVSRSEADRRRKAAARRGADLDGAALDEDVYAKQERLFTEGTSETPS